MCDTVIEVHSISGAQFAAAIRSGIHRVILEQEELNRINVFPVADGDTGTNLSLSLGAALPILSSCADKKPHDVLEHLADSLLDGARGNSGAIMAQFFQGVSDAAIEVNSLTIGSLAQVLSKAGRYAHDAISEPKEGTILSVISAFCGRFAELAMADERRPFQAILERSLTTTQNALTNTQTQLDVLRKAGVVDAGAKGFVIMLEGVCDFLLRGVETEQPDSAADIIDQAPVLTVGEELDLSFRFCTECLVTGDDIDRRKLREALSELGNSMVIAGSKRKAKIHIHVKEPDMVFDAARRFGAVRAEKVDDMQLQQHSSHQGKTKFSVITDSAADISEEDMERLDIHMVPLRIQFGSRGYLDKVSISPTEFFAKLEQSTNPPTSSQPSPADFRRQFQFLASHFSDVISINLSSTVSGTFQAAKSAASRVDARGSIHIVNSLNASTGQGLLAVLAAECASAGMSIETTLEILNKTVATTQTFALVKDLTFAVRGGRVPAYVKTAADILRLTPILKTTADGNVRAGGLLLGRENTIPRFARFISKKVDDTARLKMSIGHAVCEEEAQKLRKFLQNELPNIDSPTVCELGSALGVHGGPGTIVVGVHPIE